MHELDRILAACRALLESGRRGLLVTIVGTRGSTYRRAGARAVIGEDGSGLAYVGLLGPRRRAEELLAQLDHVTPAEAARLHSPIGLDLGGETPEDIALSIVAEVQAVLNGRDARSLNQRREPLHAPVAAIEPVPCP